MNKNKILLNGKINWKKRVKTVVLSLELEVI